MVGDATILIQIRCSIERLSVLCFVFWVRYILYFSVVGTFSKYVNTSGTFLAMSSLGEVLLGGLLASVFAAG